ncbi:MAG TPA: CAP domain-containing protein [Acidimicrobiales bacterium]|nr:CAP domain-containing protein [Acidimicrobiales bacterium]
MRIGAKRRLLAAAALGLGVVAAAGVHQATRAAGCLPQASLAPPESWLASQINQTRTQHGVAPLLVDSRLESVARSWVVQMADSGRVSHNPNLENQAPSDWEYLGENVGSGPSLQAINDAFVASADHYANIVDRNYNAMAVAAVNVNGVVYAVEDFEYSPSAADQCA